MVRRIEAAGSNVAPSTGLLGYTINGVFRTQCVTVILNQPQVVLLAESKDGFQIERITKRMSHHHSLGLGAISSFQLIHINIKSGKSHINEYGDSSILDDRSYCCGESCPPRGVATCCPPFEDSITWL